jgi:hypothetical protein
MTKSQKDQSRFGQKNHQICQEQRFDVTLRLKKTVAQAIKACPHSVNRIAADMSDLLGCTVKATTLYNWASEAHLRHSPRADWLPAFCKATGSLEPLQVITEPFKHIHLIDEKSATILKAFNLKATIRTNQDDFNKAIEQLNDLSVFRAGPASGQKEVVQ